jgi:hypothetical protein
MPIKALLINATLALASSALTLAAIEVALRLWDKPAWETELLRAGWKHAEVCRYFHIPCQVNELGYRGQPINYSDHDIVIVLLGDSQVESMACPPDMMPERSLERHLKQHDSRFRVFTLGAGGYGNDQEYLALKEYFGKYRANAVVLWQAFSNDVWNNIFPTHWPADGYIKPTYWLDHGKLKGPNYQLGEVIRKPAQTKIGVKLNKWFHPQKGLDAYWERFLPTPYQPLTHYEGSFVTDWDPSDSNNKNPNLQYENLQNEKSHFSVQLYPRSERMQYGLDLTRKLLGNIRDTASEHTSSFFIFYTLTPDDQRRLRNEDVDDVIVQKLDGLFYRTSFRQLMANTSYVNEGFTTFAIPILLETYKVSDIDSHLHCGAIDQVMRGLAEKIENMLPHG